MTEKPVLSGADLEAVEKIYRKNTTYLRCRIGWHDFCQWHYMMSFQAACASTLTGKRGETVQIDLYMKSCNRCQKICVRAKRVAKPDDLGIIVDELGLK